MALSFGSFEGGLDQKKKELLQRLANKRKVNRSGGTGSGRFGQSGMFGRGLQRGGANNALQGIAARLGGYGGSSMGAQNMFQGYPEPPAQANQQFDLGYLSQPQYQEPQAPAPQYETPQQLIDTTLGPQQTPFLTPEIMNTISPQTPFYGNDPMIQQWVNPEPTYYGNDPAIQQFINPEPTPFYGNDPALQPYVDLGSQQPAYDTTALIQSLLTGYGTPEPYVNPYGTPQIWGSPGGVQYY